MRRQGLLNARLAEVIARMGHTDLLVIADAGLPIPPGVELIDLSVTADLPRVLPVAEAVVAELAVESLVIAAELSTHGLLPPEQFAALEAGAPVEVVPHEELKRRSRSAVAVVRTGECSPYANVVLVAGVAF